MVVQLLDSGTQVNKPAEKVLPAGIALHEKKSFQSRIVIVA